jgi:predicted DNA-binding transcriptional regulator YafY
MAKFEERKNKLSELERVREIHRLIKRFSANPQNESLRVTDETLAENLDVSDRQIRRDRNVLERLIDEKDTKRGHGGEECALCFDKKLRSWKYIRDVDLSVWVGRLDDEALGSLLVAQQALAVFSGMPLAKHVSDMFEDDAGGMVGNHRSVLRNEITKLVSFYPDGAGKIDETQFAMIFRGLLLSQQLEVTYRSKASAAPVSRVLNPYHLCCFKHQWRLIAYDSRHEAVRDFVVTPRRMQSVKLLSRTFRRPAEFNAHEHLGRHKDTKVQVVKLRVARPGAHHVLERNWVGLAECKELPCGGVEAVFKVGDEGEFMRFVLSFGRDCEVLEPAAFREKIQAEAQAVICQTKPC